MHTIKVIYLTIIHATLAAAIFLYTSDRYTLARIDTPHGNPVVAQYADDWTAVLDNASHKRGRQ